MDTINTSFFLKIDEQDKRTKEFLREGILWLMKKLLPV